MPKPPAREEKAVHPAPEAKGSAVAGLRRRIISQLETSEQLIAALRRQLEESRQRNDALVRERNEMAKSMAMMDASLAPPRPRLADRDRADTVQRLEHENEKLRRRCTELEEALAERRRYVSDAAEEITCLEEQVAQLQSMVELLCEHLGLEEDELAEILGPLDDG